MDKNIELRLFFRDRMEHFDFYHLFFNSEKREFQNITSDSILTQSAIDKYNAENGDIHRTDKGMIFGFHIVRVYELCGKWVLYYKRKFFAIKTDENKEGGEGIVVYDDIDETLKTELKKHPSYDGRLNCYNV